MKKNFYAFMYALVFTGIYFLMSLKWVHAPVSFIETVILFYVLLIFYRQ